MTTRVLMVLALAGSVACGVRADGPPEIHVDRTACSHCGMLISEPVYAAAYRTPDSDPRVFDDIRCLLEAAQKEPRADALRFWFHDAAAVGTSPQEGPLAATGGPRTSPQDGPLATTGRPRGPNWIGGEDAVFVGSPTLRTPMGGGLIAYGDRAAAREGAARHQGTVINSLSDLRSNVGGTRASGQAR